MLGSPLQYQSMKAVLPYMDANTRFRISLHMPSIRSVEKMVPLKIDYLEMDKRKTKINDTEYQLGIFQHYPDGDVPGLIKERTALGGVSCDIDEFGFLDSLGRNIVLPGDISFRKDDRVFNREDTEADEIEFKKVLRFYEKALELRIELDSKGVNVEEYLNSLGPLPRDDNFREENIIRSALRCSCERPSFLYTMVDYYKLKSLPFDCRRNKTKPPFTCYIQLTITKGESKEIHRFEYDKKLFEAVKNLNEVLFGGRTMPIRVENMDFCSDGIYRVPKGFRVHVHNAHVPPDSASHKNFSSLVENSDNLDIVWMPLCLQPEEFQNQVVRNAKKLVVIDTKLNAEPLLVEVLRHLTQLEISVLPLGQRYVPEEYFAWIHSWLSGDRPVGASCWIRMRDEETVEEVLKIVLTRHENVKRTERCVTILKDNSTKVEVFYVPFKGTNGKYRGCTFNWILKTRIVKL